jgi:hypothetical protein
MQGAQMRAPTPSEPERRLLVATTTVETGSASCAWPCPPCCDLTRSATQQVGQADMRKLCLQALNGGLRTHSSRQSCSFERAAVRRVALGS